MVRQLRQRIDQWSLLTRFSVAGGIVMICATAGIGHLVSATVSSNMVQATASATALFMDSFVAPLAQELTESDTLSIGPVRALDELAGNPSLKDRVVSIKIWKADGLVAYASDTALIGQRFPVGEGLARAFAGSVTAELEKLDEAESLGERLLGSSLLEIYSPIRESWSGEVIAVAEFYENAETLNRTVVQARLKSWLLVTFAGAVVFLTLFGIVRSGSRTILQQREHLEKRMAEQQRMGLENERLRRRAERASGRVSDLIEQQLRRVSADLHDGPAQLVGLAALRLDAVRRASGERERNEELAALEQVMGEAVKDIRAISRGLSLPELAGLGLTKVAERAVNSHETRTGTTVSRTFSIDQDQAPHPVKTCLYRFIQEGLSNAARHAPGATPAVSVTSNGKLLKAEIRNEVQQTASGRPAIRSKPDGGLGLPGLKERIESLGGHFSFSIEDGQACLVMQLDTKGGAFADG